MKAFIFPGQGSQHKGMGKDLFHQYPDLVDKANKILGYDVADLCINDPNSQLNNTQYTQPLLYVVSALNYLKRIDAGEARPTHLAGHSLGEFVALFASGALDFETGLRLVKKRGELMAAAKNGGMAAVIGMKEKEILDILAKNQLTNVQIANYNTPSQIVISGPKETVIAAKEIFLANGCPVFIALNVSGAFHSKLMQDASLNFSDFIEQFEFKPFHTPVISNVYARPYAQGQIKELLTKQIISPVNWTESICYMMGKNVTEFVEVGPGNVLTGLVTKIKKEASPLIVTDEPVFSIKTKVNDQPQNVFMFSGQGSQYYQMGKELFKENATFKKSMLHFESIMKAKTGESLLDVIYAQDKRFEEFKDIKFTHPALYAIQISLTEVLKEKNITPDCVLGYSLGEYVAAAIAGVYSVTEGMEMLIMQSKELCDSPDTGGMMVILEDSNKFKYDNELNNLTIAADNYDGNFIVSGKTKDLLTLQQNLKQKSVYSELLPVNHAFHSSQIDPFYPKFMAYSTSMKLGKPVIPFYSCTSASEVTDINGSHLWNVVREKIRFKETIAHLKSKEKWMFIDLSPSGTLGSLIKHGFNNTIPVLTTLNKFGKDIKAIDQLTKEIQLFRSKYEHVNTGDKIMAVNN